MSNSLHARLVSFGIFALCFGYFASYIPYSMMTKMITKGLFSGMDGVGFSGFEIQPAVGLSSVVGIFLFITLAGWWKYATHSKVLGISIPRPQWFTLVSGIFLSGQIVTTTLAYTFSGISIVFAMLLMRGGVLAMAPVVDLVARRRKRKIYWPSWLAAALSFGALFLSFTGDTSVAMTTVAAIDISIYLFVYFFRLYFMSSRAKSEDVDEKKRYFVEEQTSANIVLFIFLIVWGLVGSKMAPETMSAKIWQGFVEFPNKGYLFHAILIGTFSLGSGIFGSLIFLDRRENTFTVPANRCASVIAGVVATYLLAILYGQNYPPARDLIGVALILGAIVFLAYRSVMERKAKKPVVVTGAGREAV